jgi:ElaB/YqjD/DUF883 family membrane-anchored ribosome-binding protein/Tfp pilus assembly protein PilF
MRSTTRSIAVSLLIALAPVTVSFPVHAQVAGADDATTSMARARFKEGVEYYDRGEFEQARASFLQAYALKKHPALLLNLAWSCLKSDHPLDAERYFKQFLVEGKEMTDKQRADANDGLTQARAKLGRIEVSAAAGTDVTIDVDHLGSAPIAEPVVVEAGVHMVKFRSADGTVDTQSVTVMGGEKAVARFKAAASIPIVGPAPAPVAPPIRPVEAVPVAKTPADAKPPAAAKRGGGALAPPKNLLPVFLLGGAAVLAYGTAGLFVVFKGQAQSKADDLRRRIMATCPPSADQMAELGPSCTALASDTDQANQDATLANVALGVGVAATVGLIVYWLVANKEDDPARSAATTRIAPVFGPGVGGVELSGTF